MFQEDLLFPWRNIYDNVLLGIEVTRPESVDSTKEEAKRLLAFFGLKEFGHKYPYQLSGGMRRRAAFVRTLLNQDRELFLFDEPTAGLDHLLRLQLEDELFRFLSDKEHTSIIITHDVETAVAVADRVLIFAPRPSFIADVQELGFARRYGSPSAARKSEDFGEVFQDILKAYMKYGTTAE